jgi:DNA-binding PadR family transcriptional regulator
MKFSFLALLAAGPAHGYELKQELEQRFDAVLPPLNAGQVYTTLQRLERDGLVAGAGVADDARNKKIYELTNEGRLALLEWVESPTQGPRLKDDFFLKLVLAGQAGIAPPQSLIDRQRRHYLQRLHDLGNVALSPDGDVVASLLVEGAALHLEADLKWLERCEERLLPRKETEA